MKVEGTVYRYAETHWLNERLFGRRGPPLWEADDIQEIKFGEPHACCTDMKNAIDDNFIGFGEYEGLLNQVGSACIYHCSPYPEGACWDEMSIQYCPFCGEEIEVELVESPDKVS